MSFSFRFHRFGQASTHEGRRRPQAAKPFRTQHVRFTCRGDMEDTWIDSYYEALEFFYWEPQHFRRPSDPGSANTRSGLVKEHLRKMEVTLNQNLHQFFSLAPDSFRNELFGRLFGHEIPGALILEGRNVDTHFKLQNCMQPDLVFTSDTHVLSVEMKVGAKSSLDQVLKYALLGLAVETHLAPLRGHGLVLLGRGDFQDQWEERFESTADLRAALAQADLDSFLKEKPKHLRGQVTRFREIIRSLDFHYLQYEELAVYLFSARPAISDSSLGAQVYRKLISGLIGELKERKLVA